MTELPETWKSSTIGEVAEIVRGVTYSKSDTLSATDNDAVPLLRATNLEVDSIDFEDMVYVPKRVVKAQQYLQLDDIFLAASSGSISVVGKSAQVVKTNGETFGAFCAVIRPKNINPKFLAYWVQSPATRDHWSATAKGTNINNLKPSDISETNIPIPPIDEQNKIVELLEDHLSRLDAALADVKQAKLKAAQFRKSLLQSIFEGQYSTSSDTWEHRTIGDFAEVKGGKRLPKGTKWSDEPTVHPYIRATDVKFGKINTEDLVHVPDSVWKSISRYVVAENDVVITIAGTIGEIAVVPSGLAGANLTENAAKLVFDHHYVMPSYLSMYLQSPSVQQEFKELSRATTQAKLALYRIATVEIPVPTLHEQQKIMELVDEKLTYLTSSLNQISAIELQASSLRRSLLQAAFTGQLTNEVVSV